MARNLRLGRQLTWRSFSYRQKMAREGSKEAFASFWADMTSPRLIPIKITFFFIMGATQCIAPFSTLFMTSLGLKLEETAIVYAVSPLIPILAPFLAGIISDRIGNFRVFLVVAVAASGLIALFNMAIPPVGIQHSDISGNYDFDLKCSRLDGLIMSFKKKKCESTSMNKTIFLDKLIAYDCGYLCPKSLISLPKMQKKVKKIGVRIHTNETHYKCEKNVKKGLKPKCYEEPENPSDGPLSRTAEFSKVELKHLESFPGFEGTQMKLQQYYSQKDDYNRFNCMDSHIKLMAVYITSLNGEERKKKQEFSKCHFHCNGQIPKRKLCNINKNDIERDATLSVWLFILLKKSGFFMIGLTFTMFEAGVVAILKEYNHDYGLQRIYGSFGGMIFAPFTGFLIDSFGKGNHYTDYYLSFGLYCGIKLICAIILTQLDLRFKMPSKSISGNIMLIFNNLEAVLLIIIVMISGMCYGFIEHFLPWYLREELKADNWLIGLTTTVSSIVAIPCLAVAGSVCNKFGHVQALSFGVVCYAIRCIGYSLIQTPIWCLPLEVLEGITTGLLVAAAIIYGAKLSDKSNIGTMQGVLATSHYGIGKSVGSLIGGYLMAQRGAVVAFRIFCAGAFLTAFAYYLAFKLILFPRHQKTEQLKKDVCSMPVKILPLNSKPTDGKPSIYTSTPKKSSEKTQFTIENDTIDNLSQNSIDSDSFQVYSLEELDENQTELTCVNSDSQAKAANT